MNTTTEHDRKLAETLRSLTLEQTVSHNASSAKNRRWHGSVLLIVFIMAVTTTAWFYHSDEAIGYLHSLISGGKSNGVETTPEQLVAQSNQSLTAKPVSTLRSNEITGSGYVVAPRSTAVFAKYQGRVTGVAVKAGDDVKAGQPVVTLTDASADFALEQATSSKASAELVHTSKRLLLSQAQASLKRKEALKGIIAAQDIEDANTALKSALNTVAQAKQDLAKADLDIRIAKEKVDALIIRAPISGVVSKINVHAGDTVVAQADSVGNNQSLMQIIDMSHLVIDVDVAEGNIALLKPGLHGEAVLDGFPEQRFAVVVSDLSSTVSMEKGTITLRLFMSKAVNGIRPGMAARVRISLDNQLIGELKNDRAIDKSGLH